MRLESRESPKGSSPEDFDAERVSVVFFALLACELVFFVASRLVGCTLEGRFLDGFEVPRALLQQGLFVFWGGLGAKLDCAFFAPLGGY